MKGYRVAQSVRLQDDVNPGGSGSKLPNMKNEFTGNEPPTRGCQPRVR